MRDRFTSAYTMNITKTAELAIDERLPPDRAVESRGILRANVELNCVKDIDLDSDGVQVPDVDNRTQEAARYVATTYDRLGFVLKRDLKLEQEILEQNADVIADMWLMTRLFVKKKWRMRNPHYAREFERLAERALSQIEHMQENKYA